MTRPSDSQASLPMYALPELEEAHRAWWGGLAAALRRAGCAAVPERLTPSGDCHALWRDERLFWSQTCGYPLTHDFAGCLTPIATPAYGAPGCEGTFYRSAVLVRRDHPAGDPADLRGTVCAVNGPASHSGYNALRHLLAPLAGGAPFFSAVVTTGGHAASLEAVASGRAAVAAVDCVTLELLRRWRPALVEPLRVLAWTAPAPGLPYVTRAATDAETLARMRDALAAALAAPELADCRAELLIGGAENLGGQGYGRVLEMEREAVDQGYPEIR